MVFIRVEQDVWTRKSRSRTLQIERHSSGCAHALITKQRFARVALSTVDHAFVDDKKLPTTLTAEMLKDPQVNVLTQQQHATTSIPNGTPGFSKRGTCTKVVLPVLRKSYVSPKSAARTIFINVMQDEA